MKILYLLLFGVSVLYGYDYLEQKSVEEIYEPYKRWQLQRKFTPLQTSLKRDYTPQNLYLNDLLDAKGKKLFTDTVYLQVFMIGTVGFLYLLPPSITKWEDTGEDTSLSQQWKDHVSAGPVWDEDDFAINYIGHPVSGAWYYMVARDDGYGPWESFFYSFVMSTFFWEYGYEAFAEIPSTQDIIFTPTLGALLGEGFYYMELQLDKQGGMLFGSRSMGNVAYFLLNPIGRITDSMERYFDIETKFYYQTFQDPRLMQTSPYLREIDYVPQSYGFMLEIRF